MGMTDKQFCAYVRSILIQINRVIENMPDGKDKEDLKQIADMMQKSIED